MGVGVDRDDYHIGQNVSAANEEEGIGIIHWDSLRDLHHPEDDDQVGAALKVSIYRESNLEMGARRRTFEGRAPL